MYLSIFSLLCQLKGDRSNDTPVAMSTPSAQILASNTIFPSKEPESFVEIADSLMAEAGNIEGKPGVSCGVSKELLKIKTKQKFPCQ